MELGDTRSRVPFPTERCKSPEIHREAEEKGEEDPEGDALEEEDEQSVSTEMEDMSGTRTNMVPDTIPPEPPSQPREDTANAEQSEEKSPPSPLRSLLPVEALPPPIRAPSPPVESDTGNAPKKNTVNTEIEEMSGDEDLYFDVPEEAPATSSRKPRPPISGPRGPRKAPTNSVTIPPQNTPPSRPVPPTPSDYIIIEKHDLESIPPPPSHTAQPPSATPPPPAPPNDLPDNTTTPQSELRQYPSSSRSVNTSTGVADPSTSSKSEAPDTETSPGKAVKAPAKERRQITGQMTQDQLKATWLRVGTQVNEVVRELSEKSKKTAIGDGTYVGFVNAVLDIVPNVSTVEADASSFGYLIYLQTGPSVTRRVAEIMPGDIIVLQDAKLKGHKGLKTYRKNIGEGTPVVAIIDEYRSRKSTVRVYQACQQPGNQVRLTMNHASMILMLPFSPSSL